MKEASTKQALDWVNEKLSSINELSDRSLLEDEKRELAALKTCQRMLRNQHSKEVESNREMNIQELSFQTYAFMNLTRDNLEDILETDSRFAVKNAKNITTRLIKEYDRLLGIIFANTDIELNDELIRLTGQIKCKSKVVFK